MLALTSSLPPPAGIGKLSPYLKVETIDNTPTPAALGQPPVPASPAAPWTGRDWLIAGLLIFGFAPLLLQFFTNLWERPYYQFFPMALAGAVLLAKRGLEELPRPLAPGAFVLTILLLLASFGLLALGLLLWSPWLAGIAALLCVAGLAWGNGGWRALRAVVPALLLLCTFIPPPLALDARLMVALRGLAVQWSSRLLDFLGVVHSLSGNVIDLPQRQLLVEEACSGINSVLLTLATCVFFLFWRRRPLWRLLVCLPFVFAGVLLGNVIRICFGAWLQFYFHHDILSGWRHETVGLILLVGYVALIVSLDECLEFLTHPVQPGPPVTPPAAAPLARPSLAAAVAPGWMLMVAVGFALLGTVTLGVRLHAQKKHYHLAGHTALPANTTFNLPARIGGWQRLDSAIPFHKAQTQGINSQSWNYQNGDLVASVAIDYPFLGYHDVRECYSLVGWSIDHAERESSPGGPGDPAGIPHMAVEMSREPVSHASLWFSTVDEEGNWLERPAVAKGLLERWQLTDQPLTSSYRVQLLVTAYAPLSAAERDQARQLFFAARQELVRQLLEKLRGKP